MIDAKEGDVFTVHASGDINVFLEELDSVYHATHFEHYIEKEKEMEKKFAKLGDKIRIVAAEDSCGYYDNGDVLEVVGTDPVAVWVDISVRDIGRYPVLYSEYEIIEEDQQDDFVFTEEHVGMEVFCLLRGKGVISEVRKDYDDDYYPVEVEFGYTIDRYTSEGKFYDDHKTRTLFFSEPVITAELFPPKKPFVPTLKKGDKVVLTDSVADYVAEVVREEENHIYYKTEDVVVTFVNKNSVNVFKLGEEIKFQ